MCFYLRWGANQAASQRMRRPGWPAQCNEYVHQVWRLLVWSKRVEIGVGSEALPYFGRRPVAKPKTQAEPVGVVLCCGFADLGPARSLASRLRERSIEVEILPDVDRDDEALLIHLLADKGATLYALIRGVAISPERAETLTRLFSTRRGASHRLLVVAPTTTPEEPVVPILDAVAEMQDSGSPRRRQATLIPHKQEARDNRRDEVGKIPASINVAALTVAPQPSSASPPASVQNSTRTAAVVPPLAVSALAACALVTPQVATSEQGPQKAVAGATIAAALAQTRGLWRTVALAICTGGALAFATFSWAGNSDPPMGAEANTAGVVGAEVAEAAGPPPADRADRDPERPTVAVPVSPSNQNPAIADNNVAAGGQPVPGTSEQLDQARRISAALDARRIRAFDDLLFIRMHTANDWYAARRACNKAKVNRVSGWRLARLSDLRKLSAARMLSSGSRYWSRQRAGAGTGLAWAYEVGAGRTRMPRRDVEALVVCVRKPESQ